MESNTEAWPLSIAVFTRFHPSVGGIETLAETLAREWVAVGHRVTIVTDVARASDDTKEFPFPVLHRPTARKVLQLVRECDLVVHNNISLKAIWPRVFLGRPFVAVHQSTYCGDYPRRPVREVIKVWMARHLAFNISASEFVRRRVGCGGIVIPNLYDDVRFRDRGAPRDKELVFVGRLVSDKGVSVLLDALGELKREGLTPSLTVVGDGPERANIEIQIVRLRLERQVALLGWQDQEATARALNEHRIMVVPSVWDEPFGIVALEGAACGCVVVGSNGGGLPEAIGPCGVTFPNGDHRRLAAILADLLNNPTELESYRRAAPEHLKKHRADVVAARYIEFFEQVLRSKTRPSEVRDASTRPALVAGIGSREQQIAD